jgi:hypothetical protein
LGSLMLSATAYAAISGTSGYDVYKQALKNTYAVSSMTPKTEVTVKDNGNLLIKAATTTKLDKTNQAMSNTMTIVSGDLEKTLDIYNQDGKTITKSSDSSVYTVTEPGMERKHQNDQWKQEDPGRIKDIENVADALVGNVQNYITLNENSDGTKEVSLKLADSQVSPVINALASLVVKNADRQGGHGMYNDKADTAFITGLRDKLPKLVDNIRVSTADLDATVSKDNLIQNQAENLVITGTDANGQNHELAISVTTGFTGFNSTTPDKVDLTGKQVKTVQHEKRGPEND